MSVRRALRYPSRSKTVRAAVTSAARVRAPRAVRGGSRTTVASPLLSEAFTEEVLPELGIRFNRRTGRRLAGSYASANPGHLVHRMRRPGDPDRRCWDDVFPAHIAEAARCRALAYLYTSTRHAVSAPGEDGRDLRSRSGVRGVEACDRRCGAGAGA